MAGTRRRTVLRAGLAAGAVTVGTAAGTRSASAAQGGGATVAVVGAGFAGAAAARELRALGYTPVVLEARDRVGGRTWTDTFAGGPVERGGTWVHWSQPHVWAELARYGLDVVEDPGPDRAILPTEDGFRSFPVAESFGRIGELLSTLLDRSTTVFDRPFDPLHRPDEVRAADGLSLRARLDQLGLSPRDESWISGLTAAYSGGTSARGAWTQMARWWSLAGGSYPAWTNATGRYRIAAGTAGLIRAILADAGVRPRLGSPVAEVAADGAGVRVVTRAGVEVAASAAVVATPVNVWRTIRFTPGLPAAHTAATGEGIGVPIGTKLWLLVRGDVGRFYAQAAEGGPIASLIPFRETPEGLVMVAFSYHASFNGGDHAQVEAAVRAFEPRARVVEVKSHDWARDEFALGAAAFQQPGQLTRLHADLQHPAGRVAFASADIASGWNGYIDGAIESGTRAARQVAAVLSR